MFIALLVIRRQLLTTTVIARSVSDVAISCFAV